MDGTSVPNCQDVEQGVLQRASDWLSSLWRSSGWHRKRSKGLNYVEICKTPWPIPDSARPDQDPTGSAVPSRQKECGDPWHWEVLQLPRDFLAFWSSACEPLWNSVKSRADSSLIKLDLEETTLIENSIGRVNLLLTMSTVQIGDETADSTTEFCREPEAKNKDLVYTCMYLPRFCSNNLLCCLIVTWEGTVKDSILNSETLTRPSRFQCKAFGQGTLYLCAKPQRRRWGGAL